MKKKIIFLLSLFTCLVILSLPVQAAVVMIDPGHGGEGTEGCGAIYPPYIEKNLTLDLASKLCAELNSAGISADMTRTSDRALSLPERANIAKNAGAKLLVSIHYNASAPHDKTGCAVWVSMYGNNYKVGAECGSQILSQLSSLGLQSKGIWTKAGSQGDYFGIIRFGTSLGIPTLIVEHCYMDFPHDRSIMESVGTAGFAHADAVGIANFIGSATGQALINGNMDLSAGAAAASAPTTANGAGASASPSSSGPKAGFTSEEWQWLLSQWAYTGNAESYINQVPVSDLKALVEEHKKGNI